MRLTPETAFMGALVLYLAPIVIVAWRTSRRPVTVLSVFGLGMLTGTALSWALVVYVLVGGKL